MKSISQRIKEHNGSSVPPVTQEEWVEHVNSIQSKVVHLYFFRNPKFQSLSQNQECLQYQPVGVNGQVLTDDEFFILYVFIGSKIKECMDHPEYGKNERETLAQISSACQRHLLGDPVFHLEQSKEVSV